LKSFKVTKQTLEDFESLLANLEANKLYFKRLPISILMCSIKNKTIRHFFLAPCLRTANEFNHYFDSDFPSDPQELELFSIKTKKTIMNDFYKLVSSNLNKKTLKNEDFINLQSFTESNVTDTSLKLGEGGFANVYSNHLINSQKQFTQKCALKIPHLKKESALMSRLRVEYEYYALKQLKHSSFTEVYGVFEVEDEDQKSLIKLGICMELLEGKSLKENVNSMTSQEKIQAMTQVAQGLSHMHAQGYVHQDIKPSNIIWHNGKAKIIDFGFAVEEESINQCIGFSYEYADPNHLKKNSPGKPADVWSWAVTFVSIFMKLEPYKDVVDRNVFRIDPNAKGPGKISIIEGIYLELEVKKKRPFFYRLENELGIVIIELLKSVRVLGC
jgi:tRNA A-37 threonylcarbamoyl transferase component Bud32